jgi:DNA-directed RNA polymerase subunit H (RpoH/RPB5)
MDLSEDFFILFLYRAKRNQVKMLMKRGYKDAKEEFSSFVEEDPSDEMKNKILNGITELNISFFNRLYDNKLQVLYIISKGTVNTKTLLKKISGLHKEAKKQQKNPEEELENKLENKENLKYLNNINIKHFGFIKHLMLITNNPLSKSTYKELKGIIGNVEFFLLEELVYDPTEYFLCPEFTLLSDEEAKKFLERNNLTYEELPFISENDPISRYYGAKPGNIFKIKRVNILLETFSEGNIVFRAVRRME